MKDHGPGVVQELVVFVDDEGQGRPLCVFRGHPYRFKPSFRNHICEDMIHEGLKGRWSIAEAKEHDRRFIETKGGDERCFPLILLFDVNVVVTPTDVEFGEQGGLLHVINQFRDERERIAIANGVAIEIAIVLAGT